MCTEPPSFSHPHLQLFEMHPSPDIVLTSEIGFFSRGEPENKILLPEMSREEEVCPEQGRVLGDVAHGDVEVAALLDRGLEKIQVLISLIVRH